MHLIFTIYFIAIALCCRLIITLYQIAASPLRSVPGPLAARFSRIWYLGKVYSGNFHHENLQLHRKYGPVVRLAPKLYSISSPDKTIYGIASRFQKSPWYDAFRHPDPSKLTLFSDRDPQHHAETRRRMQSLYSLSALVSYEDSVDQCNAIFHQKLRDFAASEEIIDLTHWFQCYAFDVVGCMTFSQRFGFLDEGKDIDGMLAAVDKRLSYASCAGIYSELHPIIYRCLGRIPSSGAAGVNKIINTVLDMIAVRKQARKSGDLEKLKTEQPEDQSAPQDFLDKMMNAQATESSKITDSHIFVMGWGNVTAGSDTTGFSLAAFFYHVMRCDSVLERLLNETTTAHTEGKCTKSRISFAEAQKLPYLQACIKETLRIHPAVGLPLWRVVPGEGAVICGRFFPGGSVVGTNSWVAHFDEHVFGPDAQQFRPERWLEESSDKLKTMEAYWMPFGLGSRTCIGRHISMLEMLKVIPVLLQNFEFQLVDDKEKWKTSNNWFVRPLDFKVRVKSRIG